MAQIRTLTWLEHGADTVFPETELPEIAARPNVGLCFSGGGSRATCAALGYLRGLLELGLLERVRYLSAVSGGAWAVAPYVFAPAKDERELLGEYLEPEQLSMATLREPIAPDSIAHSATVSLRNEFFDELAQRRGPGPAWTAAVTELFLTPFGLHDDTRPPSYTWSAQTLAALLERQAELPGTKLEAEDFVVAREDRPFPIINAALMNPVVGQGLESLLPVGFEFTPLYAGVRAPKRFRYRYRHDPECLATLGGGYVEPFALGSSGPGWLADHPRQTLTLERSETLPGLDLALGASSSAFASIIAKHLDRPAGAHGRSPILRYWSPRAGDIDPARFWELGDGGIGDNNGVFPLLARGVEHIVVFANVPDALDPDWHPREGNAPRHMDCCIPALFGINEVEVPGMQLRFNQAFPREDFDELLADLQAAKREGEPLVVTREHELLDNPFWGIHGGRTVRVTWVYLERCTRFEAQLPRRTRAWLNVADRVDIGPLDDFPHYPTLGANLLSITRLEPEQVRLLTNYCAWLVIDQRATFESIFDHIS